MTGKHSSVQRRQTLKAYGFMTPALIIIILFTIIPIIGSLVLMFYDYSVLGQTKFVGLKNFVKAFHDSCWNLNYIWKIMMSTNGLNMQD